MSPLGRAVLVLLVLASAAIAWRMLRRTGGPVAYWMLGWAAAGMGGALLLASASLPFFAPLVHVLGAFFAGLLLAGALAFAERHVPVWLLPAALAWGCVRALTAATGHDTWAWLLAFAWEPAAGLMAGAIVARAARDTGATRAERALGPALAVLAVLGVFHVGWLASGRPTAALVAPWFVVVPAVLGLQVQATADRLRRRVGQVLQERVAERTQALLASEERYRTVSELSADLSFRVRIDPALRLWPEWTAGAVAAITGRDPDALAGDGWLALVPERDRARLREELATVPLGRRFEAERAIVGPGGELRCLSLRLVAVARAADGTLDLVGSASDVTERSRAEEERRRLESHLARVQRLESLGVLAGGIAHDFNNLLAVIRGQSGLALGELGPEDPLRRRLERIHEAAGHAAALTGQMLTYAGKASHALEPLDVRETVDGLRGLLHASLPASCDFVVACAPELPAVEGDAGPLGQVVLNLVLNAADALGGKPGRVDLRVDCAELDQAELAGALGERALAPGRYVVIEVRDDGCGMDADTAARVCEPFFTTKRTGRGLGMAAVLGIVRAHRGGLQIRSEPGRGTTVRVLLPASARTALPVAAAPARPAPAEAAAGPARARVLVVDDEPAVRELTGEMLARAGFDVVCADGGGAALALVCGGEPIDAVVLDLTMPDLGGEATFLRLREERPELPVVLLSGYDAEQVGQRFAARGLDGYLHKPVEPDALVAAVRNALAR